MKKPTQGDEITILYKGATLKEKCGEVVDIPKRAMGAARFTVKSKAIFHNGGEAALAGPGEVLALRVERVTTMPDKRANLVSFYGVFEVEEAAVVAE